MNAVTYFYVTPTRKQIAMRWLFCNKVNTVLLITGHLLEKKTCTRKKGVTEILEKMKKRKREAKVQFKREPLIIFHGPDLRLKTFLCDGDTNRLIGLSMFQNLLWVYGMAWMSVRFPGLKFYPSPPLPEPYRKLVG